MAQRHCYQYIIDHDGQWFCEGNPILDQELVSLLSRSLFMREDGFHIRCDGEVHPVQVADAPLLVRSVDLSLDEEGRLTNVELTLKDGRRQKLDPDTLWSPDSRSLYCLAAGSLPAKFHRQPYYEILTHLHSDGGERFFLIIDRRRYDIRCCPAKRNGYESRSRFE